MKHLTTLLIGLALYSIIVQYCCSSIVVLVLLCNETPRYTVLLFHLQFMMSSVINESTKVNCMQFVKYKHRKASLTPTRKEIQFWLYFSWSTNQSKLPLKSSAQPQGHTELGFLDRFFFFLKQKYGAFYLSSQPSNMWTSTREEC